MSDKPVLVPGPDHPISITPTSDRVRVRFGGREIVDTDRTLVLQEASYPPVLYIPQDAVAAEVLQGSDHATYCPYKGEAAYFTLTEGDRVETDAVWTYRAPYEAVAAIAGHVAFHPGRVEVERSPV